MTFAGAAVLVPGVPGAPTFDSSGCACGRRRSSSTALGRTTTPGFMTSCGSNSALNRSMSAIASGLYMTGSSSERARPSPCSPESEPPYFATSSAASSMNVRSTDPDASSGMSMRRCTHPSPKCPYGRPSTP
ncbi:Uncharacterised protein [Mycobacteroides abscessus]|nr:Uncharacterised protein [Mycobacteroides abscessus]